MPQATTDFFPCGQYGTTADGGFWRSRCGTVITLYSDRYPRGSVAVNTQGDLVFTDDGEERPDLQAEVQAHYANALAEIAAGNVQEHHPAAGPQEVDSREAAPPEAEPRRRSM